MGINLKTMSEEYKMKDKTLVVFKPSQGVTEYEVILDNDADTLWATELQISEIFGRDRTVINRHIKNSFKEGELEEDSTSAKIAQVRMEGGRKIEREVIHYDLDVIISVGYRVKSPLATEFRKWATRKLKDYLLKGYAVNQDLLKTKVNQIKELETEINFIQKAAFEDQMQITDGFLSIIAHYSKSFKLLNEYDNEGLTMDNLSKDIIYIINYKDVKSAIKNLKANLIKKGEASDLFGREKDKSFKGILGSISQTVFEELAYPTIEEQAAQLLYSIIKGHAFSDGNKRIGSFIFVWFLEKNSFHLTKGGERKISDNTLVALSLAVAQSHPEQRDIILKLIVNLIKN